MSCLRKNPALCAFKWFPERSAEAPGFVPEKEKKCTCFVTAATAVQKLLAALWRLRSAMAESSRGKLVLLFKTASVTQRHTHTSRDAFAGRCVCVSVSEVLPVL